MFDDGGDDPAVAVPAAGVEPRGLLELVAAFQALNDELLAAELTQVADGDVLAGLRLVETQRRRLSVLDHRLIAEIDPRGLAGELCVPSTAALLRGLLRVSAAEAKRRVVAAQVLGPRVGFSGEVLPPLFAEVAAAQVTGELSAEHAAVITAAIDRLPHLVEAEHGPGVQATLVEQARTLDPAQLTVVARRIHDLLDPDGTLADEADQSRTRALSLAARRDGMVALTGLLTPECGTKLRTVMDSLARPCPGQDGDPDPRSPGQRLHDGLLDGLDRLLRSDLPDVGGMPVTVLITMTETQYTASRSAAQGFATGGFATTGSATGGCATTGFATTGFATTGFATTGSAAQGFATGGFATTGHGDLVPVATALDWAGDGQVAAIRLNPHGGIIDYGRTQRIVPAAMRIALTARDHGCSFPGCDRPPAWTQAHHIIAWQHGGRTALDNLTLVCGYHHREFEHRNWRIVLLQGVPHWIPPAWIDPDQTPRRNHTHHPQPQCALP